ncbi:hypothetical protein HPP92_007980 [Vanilla planifolia]|uniref:HRDC domain-containing protein n=1 Tax=Vanilla planifolia TaxID=51239 RepID=A0A835RDM0_VANPL|nr:hypothetical protein HPP92_007980 [Vanilla planifolia]
MEKEQQPSDSVEKKAEALRALISGPLASSVSRLLSRSRGLPSDRDFHFYNIFNDFKDPVREMASKAECSLEMIASSSSLWGSKKQPPPPDDLDDAYDWLVNLNDDFVEKFGVSVDDFRKCREKQERSVGALVDTDDGFQLVSGKKKRGSALNPESEETFFASSGIKMVSRDKKTTAARNKVPFHLPNIPRPQQEYNILVNNKNLPFDHVWLERSKDGSRFVHPLEKLSMVDFVDRNIKEDDIMKPLPLQSTPFHLVEELKGLKQLAAKLRGVDEFAVDLEHNQYRSFLGLTCLMQISTRREDFIVDTLKLRVHIGPHLREVFKDPSKRKVMHGADRDIVWLQRDFGIYVCNLFDTGQASRLLQLERNSLEYLLHHFCDVQANKEYQNADWRIRPLPDEMIKYAREDTHYLLHIYDLMRCRLLSLSWGENDPLLEVYKRSAEICLQLYEKELLTDTTFLHIYGLSEADFDSKQLAIVAGLCEWRDKVAREEDESTGYVLPNKALIEIAKQMPQSSGILRRLVKSKHQYVERNLGVVLRIIKDAIANSSAFESIAEELRKGRVEADQIMQSSIQDVEAQNNSELSKLTKHSLECTVSETKINTEPNSLDLMQIVDHSIPSKANKFIDHSCTSEEDKKMEEISFLDDGYSSRSATIVTLNKGIMDSDAASSPQLDRKVISAASVQVMKKPSCAFGALFGNPSMRKTNHFKGNSMEKEKNERKVEQIKASVILPFYPFSGPNLSEPSSTKHTMSPQPIQHPDESTSFTTMEEVLPLEDDTDSSKSPAESPISSNGPDGIAAENSKSEAAMVEEDVSLSDLSSGLQQCFQSLEKKRWQKPVKDSQFFTNITPFDYAAARETMKFGKDEINEEGSRPASKERRPQEERWGEKGQGPATKEASGLSPYRQ